MSNKKVYPPFITYCAKVIPLAFDESMSYYENICNIANHINNQIIPVVNENNELVHENNEIVHENNEIVKEINIKYNNVISYIDDNMVTIDTQNLQYYTLTNNLSIVALTGDYDDLINKPTLFSGDYNDLTNKPSIPTSTSNLINDSGFINNSVDDLSNYTTTTNLTTLLNNKENNIIYGTTPNTTYIKFDNGVMIQFGIINKSNFLTSTALSTSIQGLNIYRSNNPIINYGGIDFIDNTYSLEIMARNGISGCRFIISRIHDKTTTGFSPQLLGLEDFTTNGIGYTNLIDVEWIAIGKWR